MTQAEIQKEIQKMRDAQEAYFAKKAEWQNSAMTPEQSQALSEYWQMVFSDRPKRTSALYISKSTAQEMSYEEARGRFWAIMELRQAHIMQLTGNMDFRWQFSEQDRERNVNLLKYFINDPSSAYDLKKGLFLYGAPGTGKTEIMQAFQRFCEQYELSKAFHYSHMPDVYSRVRAGDDEISTQAQFDRCLDEFGRITGSVMLYGNPIDPNEAIIEARYIRFKNYGQLTHIITNATPSTTKEAFTPALYDRIRSMCTPVLFAGQSKRK